jgi:sec-independent protein translocase protein TatB
MFDIGWGEMLVIAIVVIVVVGPKELPGMANDFRKQFDEALKEAELDDLKKVADDVRALNPKNEIRKALSPMEKAAQDVRAGLDAAFTPAPKPQADPEPASPDAGLVAAEPLKNGAVGTPVAVAAPAVEAAPLAAAAIVKPAKSAAKAGAKKPAPAKTVAAPKAPSAPKSTAAVSVKTAAKPRTAKTKERGDAT